MDPTVILIFFSYNFCIVALLAVYDLGSVWGIGSLDLFTTLCALAGVEFHGITVFDTTMVAALGTKLWLRQIESVQKLLFIRMDAKCRGTRMVTFPFMCAAQNIIFDFIVALFRIPPRIPFRERLLFGKREKLLRCGFIVAEWTCRDRKKLAVFGILQQFFFNLCHQRTIFLFCILLVENAILVLS